MMELRYFTTFTAFAGVYTVFEYDRTGGISSLQPGLEARCRRGRKTLAHVHAVLVVHMERL